MGGGMATRSATEPGGGRGTAVVLTLAGCRSCKDVAIPSPSSPSVIHTPRVRAASIVESVVRVALLSGGTLGGDCSSLTATRTSDTVRRLRISLDHGSGAAYPPHVL
jgi:hypothetical protein